MVQQTLKGQEKLGTEHRVPCAPPMASPSPLPSTGMGTAAKTGLPARHGNAPLRTHSLAHPLTLHRGFIIPLCSPDPKSNPLLQDILAPIENPPPKGQEASVGTFHITYSREERCPESFRGWKVRRGTSSVSLIHSIDKT